jgi:peptidoglycan/LPS O-acetylase OafA/YrhL
LATISMLFGILMTSLGVVLYTATYYLHRSDPTPSGPAPTALIPAAFGIALVLLGAFARGSSERSRKHIMHLAALIGLIGTIAPLVVLAVRWKGWGPAPIGMIIFAALSGLFLILCINSFLSVRRARKQREQQQPPTLA